MRNHTNPPAPNQRHLPVRKRLSRDRHRHDFRLFIFHERKGELGSLRGGVTALFRDLCPHPSCETQTNIYEAINTTEQTPGTKQTERLKKEKEKKERRPIETNITTVLLITVHMRHERRIVHTAHAMPCVLRYTC